MFQDIMNIVKKEMARVFTDKKLVFTTFVLPALSLIMIYSVMGIMMKDMITDRQKHQSDIRIVQMPESFNSFIKQSGETYNIKVNAVAESDIKSLKAEVYDGKLDALVVFPTDFDSAVKQYQKTTQMPKIEVFYNPTEDYSDEAYNKLQDNIFADYEEALLGERFGDVKYLKAFSVNQDKGNYALAPVEKMSGNAFSGFLPMLLSIFLFSGGMGIGIDLIAGEKERGTMATLLVTPIRREAIAFGKIISLGIVALISTVSSLAGMLISLPLLINSASNGASDGGFGGMQFFLMSPVGLFQFLLLCVVLSIMYVGIICVISVYANSIKEAGTLVTPAYLAIMMIGAMTAFTSGQPTLPQLGVPMYGVLMAMKLSLTGELTWTMFLIACGVSAIVIAAIVALIRYMFNSEKIMFGA